MKKALLLMAFLVCFIVSLTGCLESGRSNSNSESTPEDMTKAKAIEKSLYEGFGMPGHKVSWYDYLKGISVKGDTLIAKTNLPPHTEEAKSICSVLSGFVFTSDGEYRLTRVQVYGANDRLLIDRSNVSQPCAP